MKNVQSLFNGFSTTLIFLMNPQIRAQSLRTAIVLGKSASLQNDAMNPPYILRRMSARCNTVDTLGAPRCRQVSSLSAVLNVSTALSSEPLSQPSKGTVSHPVSTRVLNIPCFEILVSRRDRLVHSLAWRRSCRCCQEVLKQRSA